jgi:hypothetical protein
MAVPPLIVFDVNEVDYEYPFDKLHTAAVANLA